jgi:hypothetical protein
LQYYIGCSGWSYTSWQGPFYPKVIENSKWLKYYSKVFDYVPDTSQQEAAIIELFNPVYNETNKKLIYDIRPDNATSIDLPNEFGHSTIIIDSGCPFWIVNC